MFRVSLGNDRNRKIKGWKPVSILRYFCFHVSILISEKYQAAGLYSVNPKYDPILVSENGTFSVFGRVLGYYVE